MDLGFRMHAERTPNPNSVKWVLSQPVAGVYSANFAETPPPADVSVAVRAVWRIGVEQRMEQLEACVARLSEQNRDVLWRFYNNGESMIAIADALKRQANAVGQMLFRIRKTLIQCVSGENSEVVDVI